MWGLMIRGGWLPLAETAETEVVAGRHDDYIPGRCERYVSVSS